MPRAASSSCEEEEETGVTGAYQKNCNSPQ